MESGEGGHRASAASRHFSHIKNRLDHHEECSYAMKRWLADREGDRLVAGLAMSPTSSSNSASPGPDDEHVPAASMETPDALDDAARGDGVLPGSLIYEDREGSMRQLGSWCNTGELRFVSPGMIDHVHLTGD